MVKLLEGEASVPGTDGLIMRLTDHLVSNDIMNTAVMYLGRRAVPATYALPIDVCEEIEVPHWYEFR
jgi:hypothetical protein